MTGDMISFVAVGVCQGPVVVLKRAVVRPRGTGMRDGTAASSVAASVARPGTSENISIKVFVINT